MSIWTSLYTGSSGLSTLGQAIGVVGDNIANTSTVGFKASRASFRDMIGGAAPNGQRLGTGVRFAGAQVGFGQGSVMQTGAGLDFAIQGGGFFVVNGSHEGMNGTFLTRDGRFQLDKEGFLVTSNGLKVQGYSVDTNGQISASSGDMQLGAQNAPVATSNVDLSVNLDASAPVLPPWDPANPGATSNYSSSVTVYDSLGAEHRVDLHFRSDGNGAWSWYAMVDGGELTGGTPGQPTEIASGSLSFTPEGLLDVQTVNASSADFIGATPGQSITFDFGDALSQGGTGQSGTTQYAGAFNLRSTAQDGFGAGELVNVSVAPDGTVTGIFSNGQSRPMAQLALASVRSEDGLRRAGGQLFQATQASGEPLLGAAGTGSRGAVVAGALESSNVDLSNELVTLIAYQRAFQANARTVSTADEMLAEVANLKR